MYAYLHESCNFEFRRTNAFIFINSFFTSSSQLIASEAFHTRMWRSRMLRTTARSVSRRYSYSATVGQAATRCNNPTQQLLPVHVMMGGRAPPNMLQPVQGRLQYPLFDSVVHRVASGAAECKSMERTENMDAMMPTLRVMPMQNVGFDIMADEDEGGEGTWQASSTLKKRRLKMNKHKYRKRRKRDRQRNK